MNIQQNQFKQHEIDAILADAEETDRICEQQQELIASLEQINKRLVGQIEKKEKTDQEASRVAKEALADKEAHVKAEKALRDRTKRILTGVGVGLSVGVLMALVIPSGPVAAVGTAVLGVAGAESGDKWPKAKTKLVDPNVRKIKNVWNKVKKFFK